MLHDHGASFAAIRDPPVQASDRHFRGTTVSGQRDESHSDGVLKVSQPRPGISGRYGSAAWQPPSFSRRPATMHWPCCRPQIASPNRLRPTIGLLIEPHSIEDIRLSVCVKQLNHPQDTLAPRSTSLRQPLNLQLYCNLPQRRCELHLHHMLARNPFRLRTRQFAV